MVMVMEEVVEVVVGGWRTERGGGSTDNWRGRRWPVAGGRRPGAAAGPR